MTIAVNATKEALAAAYAGQATHASLHTGNPGTTGANEVSGGGYARKPLTWTPGASDGATAAAQVEFDVPAGTYTHVGLWSALTGGVFVDLYDIPTDIVMSVAGKIRVTPTYTQS
ncbi:hypothetical protein SEA_MAGRITTE_25 [Microbacterium phage Magritte]|nr:hypothetical protein SEA_MAGRITTE_25 [Microbacterium phage Magritte]